MLPGASFCVGLGAIAVMAMVACGLQGGPVRVELERTGAGFRLLRGGRPFFIQGAGGDHSRQALRQVGGNSLRTWGVGEETGRLLDEAHRLGLTVCLGLWLGHERHGFDYHNPALVREQYERVGAAVRRYRDHPAVLLWGLGNEMEGSGDDPAVWKAVEDIARLVRGLDPHHPTMTVIAEVGGDKVANLHRLCPSIDIVGINAYGGAPSIPARYRRAGGRKPYILTEFGPLGPWEVGRTRWGAPLEASSTEKGEQYRRSWQQGVLAERDRLCLGGYAFLWGHKQEATATWFGMVLPDGSRLEPVDVMTEQWTGMPPANRCPHVERIVPDHADAGRPGDALRISVEVSDPEDDPLEIAWVLRREVGEHFTGGDPQATPPAVPHALHAAEGSEITVVLPAEGGAYRLFAFVRDHRGGAATVNVPLFVEAPPVEAWRAIPGQARAQGALFGGGITCSALYDDENGITREQLLDMATRGPRGELVDAWREPGVRHGSLSSPACLDYLFRWCREQLDVGVDYLFMGEINAALGAREGYDDHSLADFRRRLLEECPATRGWTTGWTASWCGASTSPTATAGTRGTCRNTMRSSPSPSRRGAIA